MAAVTLLGTATFNTTNGSKTVTATPAVNDLIVIVTAHSGNTATTAPTDNQGGTYTLIDSALTRASADRICVFVRDSLVSSAVSTVYTHAPGTTSGGGLAVLKVTGMTRTGSSAARQSATDPNQAATETPEPIFASAVLTANPVIGGVLNATSPATLTPRTSFTERVDVGYSTPTTGLEVMSRDSGETGTNMLWGSTSASAFGAIAVELDTSAVAQTLTPTLFTNSQTFYTPTVSVGAVGLTPSLFTNTNTFYVPTVSSNYPLTPGLFTNTNSFFTSTITQSQVVAPALVTNTNTFYGPTVTTGSVNLVSTLFTNTSTLYSPTVVPGAVTLTPSLLTNTNSFFGPSLSVGAVNLSPPLHSGVAIFYGATVTAPAPGSSSLLPDFVTNTQVFYGPTVDVSGGPQILSPPTAANDNTFYEPTISQVGGSVTLFPNLFTNNSFVFEGTGVTGVSSIPFYRFLKRGTPINQYKKYKTLKDFRRN